MTDAGYTYKVELKVTELETDKQYVDSYIEKGLPLYVEYSFGWKDFHD